MSAAALTAGAPPAQQGALLLTRALLIDGTGRAAIPDSWVHVEGTTIVAVGRGQPPQVKNARTVDLSGRTLLPGLSDMHVHLGSAQRARWVLSLLLAHGVTTVKEAGNSITNDEAIKAWLNQTPIAPHLYMSGVTLNGDRVTQRFLQPGPAITKQLEANRALGAKFIKLHNFVSSAALEQMVAFGRADDVPVTGRRWA